jgi:hypothetical protein
MKLLRNILLMVGLLLLANLQSRADACAACFGKSDSPMAQGLNAGIFTLMGVIGTVLCGFSAFFVYIARKAAHGASAKEIAKP